MALTQTEEASEPSEPSEELSEPSQNKSPINMHEFVEMEDSKFEEILEELEKI